MKEGLIKTIYRLRLVPVILFAAAVPLLVHAMSYSLPLGEYEWIATMDDTVLWDVFSLIKLWAVCTISVFAVLMLAVLAATGSIRIRKLKLYIPMAVYIALVLLSFITSPYKEIAWLGSMNRFEGTLAILSYMVMLFYTIQVVEEVRDAVIVLGFLAGTVLTECIIGLTQLEGCDVLFSSLGRAIIAGDMEIEPVFASGQVYQTVSNMDYVPFWLCLVVPLILLTAIECIKALKSRKPVKMPLLLAVCALLLILIAINCYGAGSMGGVIGMTASLCLLAISYLPSARLRIIAGSVFAAVGLAIVFAVFLSFSDPLSIDYIQTGNDSVDISIDGAMLTFAMDKEAELRVLGESGEVFMLTKEHDGDEFYRIDDPAFWDRMIIIPFVGDGERYVMLEILERQFLFHYADDEVYFCNPYGYEIPLDKEVSDPGALGCLFKGRYGFMSGRGYIWAMSMPLIRDHLLLGSGADTFMPVFPQTDYAGKVTSGGAMETIVDKAHSLYIQMAVTTGGLSLIAFIIMIVKVYAGGIKALKAHGAGVSDTARLIIRGLLLGITGFFISGAVCDSIVSVMPVFYTILGITIALSGQIDCIG